MHSRRRKKKRHQKFIPYDLPTPIRSMASLCTAPKTLPSTTTPGLSCPFNCISQDVLLSQLVGHSIYKSISYATYLVKMARQKALCSFVSRRYFHHRANQHICSQYAGVKSSGHHARGLQGGLHHLWPHGSSIHARLCCVSYDGNVQLTIVVASRA